MRLTADTNLPVRAVVADDKRQVEKVLHLVWKGEAEWVASIILDAEIRRNPNREGRNDALRLISLAGEFLRPHALSIERARTFETLGYGAFDGLHLACGEQAYVLLTTDDRFIRQAERRLGKPTIRVLNPIDWIREMGR